MKIDSGIIIETYTEGYSEHLLMTVIGGPSKFYIYEFELYFEEQEEDSSSTIFVGDYDNLYHKDLYVVSDNIDDQSIILAKKSRPFKFAISFTDEVDNFSEIVQELKKLLS